MIAGFQCKECNAAPFFVQRKFASRLFEAHTYFQGEIEASKTHTKKLQMQQSSLARSKAPSQKKRNQAKKKPLMLEAKTPIAEKKEMESYMQARSIPLLKELKKYDLKLENLRILLEVYTNKEEFKKGEPDDTVWLSFPPKPVEKFTLQEIMQQIEKETDLTQENLSSVGYKVDSIYLKLNMTRNRWKDLCST